MAAVTRGSNVRPTMPPGYEDVAAIITLAGEDLEAGDAVYLDGTDGWKLATNTEVVAGKQCGMAAQDYDQGRNDCSILLEGEMEYATGLTPGAPLWIGSVAGDLVDAAPTFAATTPAVPVAPKIWAQSETTIRFKF